MQLLTEKTPEPGNIRHVYIAPTVSPVDGSMVKAICGNVRFVDKNTFSGFIAIGSFVCLTCFTFKHAYMWHDIPNPPPFNHPFAVEPAHRRVS